MKDLTIHRGKIFELEEFICRILSGYKACAHRQGIEFHIMDDLASYVTLVGDTQKIKLLLDTVFQNTIDRSGAKMIRFSTRQLLKSDKEILLEFLLQDDGNKPKSFSYYRSLARAKGLIESLNGKTEIISAPGLGTTLKFIIKCAWKDPAENKDDRLIGCTCSLHRKRLLIAEDNEINQKAIIQILEKENIRYDVAADGREVIDLLEKNEYDLVLMDLYMPGMDGFETSNYIRKKLKSCIPIIGMTLEDHASEGIKCREVGMNQFIKKPFSAEELLAQLCRLFDPVPLENKGGCDLKTA